MRDSSPDIRPKRSSRWQNGGWCIFNDEKVESCEEPPFDAGYVYVYEQQA